MKKAYKRFIRHIKAWNGWRKRNLNSRFYKFLVLIGVMVSPTFEIHKAWGIGPDEGANLSWYET